jgi:hypothetical protein
MVDETFLTKFNASFVLNSAQALNRIITRTSFGSLILLNNAIALFA